MRLYAVPVVFGGKRLGTVVAGVLLAPYEQTRRTTLIGSLAFALLLLLVVAVAARWLLAAALRPVARMTEAAAEWSDRSLDRRFELGAPHDELTRLAATLDNLLDRIAASLRHEQRFSAELSHELRTPVARIVAEADLALRRERPGSEYRAALEVVLRNAQQVASTIEALVAAAQQEAGLARGTADAYEAAARVARRASPPLRSAGSPSRWRSPRARSAWASTPSSPPASSSRSSRTRFGTGAARSRSPSTATAARSSTWWRTTGPASTRRSATGSSRRADEAPRHATAKGAGLGLALARRLARAASGEVEAMPNGAGGGRFK